MRKNGGIAIGFVVLLAALAVWFPPPSGYIGARAQLEADNVWFIDLMANFPGTGMVEISFVDVSGNRLTQREPFFHGGSGMMRFYIPPQMLESIEVSATPDIQWEVIEIIDLGGETIALLESRPGETYPTQWFVPEGPMKVPPVFIPTSLSNVVLDAAYVFLVIAALLSALFWGLPVKLPLPRKFVLMLGGSFLLALIAILGTLL